jgi:hypothetical protein
MLEKWNDGMAPFGHIYACSESREDRWVCGFSDAMMKRQINDSLCVIRIEHVKC